MAGFRNLEAKVFAGPASVPLVRSSSILTIASIFSKAVVIPLRFLRSSKVSFSCRCAESGGVRWSGDGVTVFGRSAGAPSTMGDGNAGVRVWSLSVFTTGSCCSMQQLQANVQLIDAQQLYIDVGGVDNDDENGDLGLNGQNGDHYSDTSNTTTTDAHVDTTVTTDIDRMFPFKVTMTESENECRRSANAELNLLEWKLSQ